ncbi:MAG: 4-hydroxy-tetrahydrodipicolinate synthase [Nitrospinota bacterium]|jgi:4-hydroxy-tetrahydrodipicolinate synthase|nr:4-hydroxy-tetrahydrodipicolinate synthase [Nitrospinota bacterium]MDP7663380.1 4-hydroxy-tetrahydrodipicolinate synthase [Nitrospinota bacterium]
MFEGSNVAIVTPFRDGKVDEDGIRALVDFHLENGTHGIVACGTTGEAVTLSHEEQDAVIDLIIKRVDGRIPVIAGSGSNSTAEAVRRTQFAKSAGANGALVVVPYYNKPTQEGLYQHFKAVAESADIPIVVYNVPGRTVINIAPETIARLAEIPNIAAIKEASGDLKMICSVIDQCPDDFTVLSGDDFVNLPLMMMGGKGTISVTANVAPADVSEMCQAQLDGDTGRALELHYKMWELNKMMFIESNPIPAKATLHFMGKCNLEFRLPMCPPSAENLKKLEAFAKSYGLVGEAVMA